MNRHRLVAFYSGIYLKGDATEKQGIRWVLVTNIKTLKTLGKIIGCQHGRKSSSSQELRLGKNSHIVSSLIVLGEVMPLSVISTERANRSNNSRANPTQDRESGVINVNILSVVPDSDPALQHPGPCQVQTLGTHHSGPNQSKSLRMKPNNLCFNKLAKSF